MPFDAKFVSNPQDYTDNGATRHYKADKQLINQLNEYKNEFFNLLLEHIDSPMTFPSWIDDITSNMIKSQDKLGSILDGLFEKEEDNRFGLSWVEMKNLMKKEKMYHQLNFNSEHQLFEKVCERLNYATLLTNSNVKPYISTASGYEEDKKSKKFFCNIRLKNDDENGDTVCEL
jgi:hypothetical protein